jgi:hypothetical protein
MSRVCRSWSGVTRQQNFWRTFTINEHGKDIAPLRVTTKYNGNVDFNYEEYLLPTIKG